MQCVLGAITSDERLNPTRDHTGQERRADGGDEEHVRPSLLTLVGIHTGCGLPRASGAQSCRWHTDWVRILRV